MTAPIASMTLEEAQEWLRGRVDDGETCPCCTQFAKVYRRKLSSQTARILIAMWWRAGTDWCDVPALAATMRTSRTRATGGDETKARYWGLIEPMPNATRDDGSTRVGWWRLTRDGAAFVHNQLPIAKYARIYNGRLLGLDDSETITISEALGTRFNYTELMQGI